MKVLVCRFLVAATVVFLARAVSVHGAEHSARASVPHPPAPYIEPTEPVTRTLSQAEATALLEDDWLFQAENRPTTERICDEIRWARELALRLQTNPETSQLKSELEGLERLAKQAGRLVGDAGDGRARRLYFQVRRVKRRIMFKNPVVDFSKVFSKVIFIDNAYPRGSEWKHQARHRNGMMAVPGGRLLVLDGLGPAGKVRKLAPEKPGGFWRPDLSFDAQKVLFCYKAHDERSFHLYEINIDG
ncbi:MAG: hypothetical protein ACYTEQ_19965, partial [Planctomycetota bacterium]